jgi:hypothetical protein
VRTRGLFVLAAALLIPACQGGGSPPASEAPTAAGLEAPPEGENPQSGEQPLGSGQPPQVLIVSPATSTVVQEGATLNVQAVVVSPTAIIVQAELFDGSRRVGSRNTAPFIFALGGLSAGSHILTVVALDLQGLTAVSAPVTVFVVARS